MHTFFVPPHLISDSLVNLPKDESHHAVHVLRLTKGDEVFLVDGVGNRYTSSIVTSGKKEVTVQIISKENFSRPKPHLTIALGLIKNRQRLEWAIEKMTELGVSRIVLFHSERSERSHVRLDRLESVAVSAMKQSLGIWLPEIETASSIREICNNNHDELQVITHEKNGDLSLSFPQLSQKITHNPPSKITCLVGPEGGFSEDEVDLAIKTFKCVPVHLGDLRLRAETAAVIMTGLLRQSMNFENN